MITKKTVDAAKPGQFVWDGAIAGFGLRCRQSSGRRYYFLKYRFGRRTRWVTIGTHGAPWTPALARQEAKRLLGEVAAGRDPAATRDAGRTAPTVAEAIDHFVIQHVRTKTKQSTAREYERQLRRYIRPALGRFKVADVTPFDIARLHHSLVRAPYLANRVAALLSKFFSWSEQHGLRPDGSNPVRRLEHYKEHKRHRFLGEAEIARLGATLTDMERSGEASPWECAAIRLLAMTGCRRGEVLSLKWSEVDFEHSVLRLADSKTGQKTIYLNAPAKQILATLPRVEENPFVILRRRSGKSKVDLTETWGAVRERAKLDGLRIHDLRHSFASVGAAGGLSLLTIGTLLGHRTPSMTARYAHLSADPLRAANEQIGAVIARALNPPPEAPPANIRKVK